jgi:hypothetical protein
MPEKPICLEIDVLGYRSLSSKKAKKNYNFKNKKSSGGTIPVITSTSTLT